MPQGDYAISLQKKELKRRELMAEKVVVQGKNCIVIPMSKGFKSLIDIENFDVVKNFIWFPHKIGNNFYAKAQVTRNGITKRYLLHQIVFGNKGIDHINGDSLDNRKCNLRLANHSQNSMNAKKRFNCSSIYKGVSFKKDKKKWSSIIGKDSKRKLIGYFKTELEASIAYDREAIKLFGEFARLNHV